MSPINIIAISDPVKGGAVMYDVAGQAAVTGTGDIYVMSSRVGEQSQLLVRLHLPTDICGLYRDTQSCINSTGCAVCTVTETEQSFCYSNNGSRPSG